MKSSVFQRRTVSYAATVLFVASIIALVTGCASQTDERQLTFEVRAPTNWTPASDTRINFIEGADAAGTSLNFMSNRIENGFAIYSQSWIVHEAKPRYSFTIEPYGDPIEVFYLPIKGKLPLGDWTIWQGPNRVDTDKEAGWKVMHERAPTESRLPIPSNHFELRYKVTKYTNNY